ncbi:MAG TPA: glycosyl hydrolase 115 family protein, partial [Bryobacteraceae bacterium]|nr:glycosyl hydrolase 115 family protein [Bryobacteraceae bacterium]
MRFLSFAFMLSLSAPLAVAQQVAIDSSAVLLVPSDEPDPVREAAKDLAGDFEKVFGKKPRITTRSEDAAAVTILIGSKSTEVQKLAPRLTEPESFSISVHRSPTTVVLLAGADMRGAIFAVYHFAQQYLGIDPMYYWTDHAPARRAKIDLPASLNQTFPGPVIRYRGFFLNDEDLLTGWAPGTRDGTGISLDAWNKIYETILRLKGNIVAPGTWIFPDEPQIRLAAKRGLIVTQHHAIPLGMNVARWPKGVPYNYTAHPEILERAWKNAVAAYPAGQEILWTVGLRGLSDVSYAAADPSVAGNPQALGKLVGKAIAAEMHIVRERDPNAHFITNLWQEGATLVRDGYLTIPSEVNTVWADDGFGYLQDRGQVTAGQGAYYHVAMMNRRANQLTEMVPVERIYSELGRYIKAGATHYMLLNTSDLRPVSMTTKAVMELSWGGLAPDVDARRFYRDWSAAQFGEKAADKVAAIYQDYFEAPARTATEPAREYGDQYYHTQARNMMLQQMVGSPQYQLPGQSPKWVPAPAVDFSNGIASAEVQRCKQAQPRWDALWSRAVEAESLVLPARRPFYSAHVLAMISICKESNRILGLTAEAIQDLAAGNRVKARAAVQRALASAAEIRKAEVAAE